MKKYSSEKLIKSICRHIGANVEEVAFFGGRVFHGDKGTVECYYPVDEVFSSAARDGVVKTVYI